MKKLIRLTRKIMERAGLKNPPFFIRDNPDFGWIEAGAFSYGKPLVMGYDGTPETRVTIGKFCSIADGVRLLLRVNHPVDSPSTYPLAKIMGAGSHQPYEWCRGPITIGHDVWIGQDAVILGGVTIGNGAIVGGYSVVTRDVPPYAIVAGNPARIVKQRFDDQIIAKLAEIKWWDWPEEKIRKHAVALSTGSITSFLDSLGSDPSVPK